MSNAASGMSAAECRTECAKLIEWFRGDGAAMGQHGDDRNWTPAETAIYFMRACQRISFDAVLVEMRK